MPIYMYHDKYEHLGARFQPKMLKGCRVAADDLPGSLVWECGAT
jgi:hypothetical protein